MLPRPHAVGRRERAKSRINTVTEALPTLRNAPDATHVAAKGDFIMRVVIQDDYQKMCKWAADYIANKIRNHKEDRPFVLGLPTGSSPIGRWPFLSLAGR